ncbi:bifunctional 2-polyprenyl-6-hydroxyphenol methylase/3-demethylubiquinol 3-O-methyltransferase UbiG [Mechercharimyces sp. CAU 1602]|uniref:class I SAM-dependent methyltransferase n=1 Tax=Mechercharimyces sp. CAU 1602 TaxID=2973933 RepID=UPI002161F619|nr:class I SAM-dependent methyltransferase [Mechercharimyces sp. CAU 1602]MCS1350386.1 class I SAM-dependent methyltransferase [Mechercharimyces sp. CAU 1602]
MSIHTKQPDSINEVTQFFDSSYMHSHHYLENLMLRRQYTFLTEYLNRLSPQPKVLDFCCGYGRHLLPLTAEGYDITGLDINEYYLQHIKEQNQEVSLIQADARFFQGTGEYDVVLNLETSIVYQSDEDSLKMLKSMHSCLKPGGTLLLHLANREYVLKNFQHLVWFDDGNGGYVLRKQGLDPITSTLHIQETRLSSSGEKQHYNTRMRLFAVTEVVSMLHQAGFHTEKVYGDFSSSPYTTDSTDIVITCQK